MEKMGRQRLIDKVIKPQVKPQEVGPMPQQLAGLTVAEALQNRLGIYLLGGYKGQTVFVDLDKLVNQPLVKAEQLSITGILDGREEGHDLVTVTNPLGALVGTQVRGRLPVPSGQVWYISAVVLTIPADATAVIAANWRCSLWTDRAATPDPDGQPFHAADVADVAPAGAGIVQTDEFGPWTTLVALTNKTSLLRLPAGAVITAQGTVTTAPPTAAVQTTLQLYGFIGKPLVA